MRHHGSSAHRRAVAAGNTGARGGSPPALPALLSDITQRNPPTVAKPAYLTPLVDPTFGSIITRITGNVGDVIPNVGGSKTWGDIVRIHYSVLRTWNCDGSLIFLETNKVDTGVSTGGALFLNGNTYAAQYWRTYKGNDMRWSATDPNLMYYLTANELRSFNVSADTTASIHVFTGYNNDLSFGAGDGEFTFDGDMVCLCGTRTSDSHEVAFAYKLSTNTKYSDIDATAKGKGLLSGAANISPLGNYIRCYWTDETQSIYLYDGTLHADWTETQTPSHAGDTVDEYGEEVVVGRWASGAGTGNVIKRRYSDGGIIVVNYPSFAYHTTATMLSGGKWVAADYWADSDNGNHIHVDEMCAILIDGTATYRICHHHNYHASDYEAEPHPCLSPDGKKIIFGSDWGAAIASPVTTERPIQTYVADFSGFSLPDITDVIVNGSFLAGSGSWTPGAGWAVANGIATKTAGSATSIKQTATIGNSQTWKVQYTILTRSAGTVRAQLEGGTPIQASTRNAAGTYTETLTTNGTITGIGILADATFAGTIDNIKAWRTA